VSIIPTYERKGASSCSLSLFIYAPVAFSIISSFFHLQRWPFWPKISSLAKNREKSEKIKKPAACTTVSA
jgi:hypothetical protein